MIRYKNKNLQVSSWKETVRERAQTKTPPNG